MKKQKQRAATTFTRDQDGRRIAHVALSGTNERAKMLADDLKRILADGYSPCWAYASTGYRFRYILVRALNPKESHRSLTVARLVAHAGKGQIVKYADGDRLNLLPENLLAREGAARAAVHWLQPRKDSSAAMRAAETPQIPRTFPQAIRAPQ